MDKVRLTTHFSSSNLALSAMHFAGAGAILAAKENLMSKNILVELSDALADAAENAGKATVLVNARRRMPASGIVFANDLVLTADHVVERDEDIKIVSADNSEISARLAGRDPGSDLAVLKLERVV